jgi:hypothetical protein
VLRLGLVDGDHRVAQRIVGGHRAQANDAGRRLLGPGHDLADLGRSVLVEQRDEVAPVIHGQDGVGVGHGVEVPVVRVAVLAAPGVDRDAVLADEGRRDVVLGG